MRVRGGGSPSNLRAGVAVAIVFAALTFVAAPAAQADLSSLQASCSGPKHPQDAPSLSYVKCDDGVPAFGGTTPNPTGANAVLVPASYSWPSSAGKIDPTVDGLPPAASDPTCSQVQGSAPSTTDPGTCTVALDVNVTMPSTPPPPGGYPLIVMMHGCCSGSKADWESDSGQANQSGYTPGKLGPSGEQWHYNNVWYATRGYVVLTYTARGFVNGSGDGSTGQTQIDSLQYEMNDMQSLAGQLADDSFFHINPQDVVVTGGSYGGGFSWLALVDPTWTSPGSKSMKLAAVAPRYGWTDLVDSLVPTGRQFYDRGPLPATDGSDSGLQPPGSSKAELVGIPKRSIVAALYASGKTGIPPGSSHATFPSSIDQSFQCTQTLYPSEQNPACAQTVSQVLPDFIRYRSAYYWNEFFDRIRSDPSARIPVFSAGTLTDPLFPPIEHRRMVDRLQQTVRGYPVQEYYGDYEHFAQNKDKEWADICGSDHHVCGLSDYPGGDVNANPSDLIRTGATTRLDRFIDYYAKPAQDAAQPQPSFDATASTQVCENKPLGQRADEPGPTFTAPTFAALTPGALELDFSGDQTTTSKVGGNTHAVDADPVANQVNNNRQCVIETSAAGPGVATYESPPLPSQATMIGGTVVSASYSATNTQGLELNARLYDLLPDGSAILVDRGPRRIDPARDGTTSVRFQLHGNGWRFHKGDRVRIELTQDDDPYLHSSDIPSSMTISHVHLSIPVHERTSGGVPGGRHVRPKAKMLAPRLASDVSSSRRFRIRWRGSAIGSSIKSFRVEARQLSGRGRHRWHVIHGLGRTHRTSALFRGAFGQTYEFRVVVTDRAGRKSRPSDARTIVPTQDRPAGANFFGPWRSHRRRGAFGGSLITCASKRCQVRYRYRGGDVYVLAETSPAGGKALVRVDRGRARVISLYSKRRRFRVVVFHARRKRRAHRLSLVVLAKKPHGSHGTEVALDGFAVRSLR